jgi:hypothetical protein
MLLDLALEDVHPWKISDPDKLDHANKP